MERSKHTGKIKHSQDFRHHETNSTLAKNNKMSVYRISSNDPVTFDPCFSTHNKHISKHNGQYQSRVKINYGTPSFLCLSRLYISSSWPNF